MPTIKEIQFDKRWAAQVRADEICEEQGKSFDYLDSDDKLRIYGEAFQEITEKLQGYYESKEDR